MPNMVGASPDPGVLLSFFSDNDTERKKDTSPISLLPIVDTFRSETDEEVESDIDLDGIIERGEKGDEKSMV